MVRAFFGSFLVCPKSIPNRSEITEYTNQHLTSTAHEQPLNEISSDSQASDSGGSEPRQRNHSVIGYSVNDNSILNATGCRSVSWCASSSSTRDGVASSAQATPDLTQYIFLERKHLITYQALDKWVEKWQETEFQRANKQSCGNPNYLKESLTRLKFENPNRKRRKSAQGRALSEHAKLSARHCQRRELLIRKVLEVVGQPDSRSASADRLSEGSASGMHDLTSDSVSAIQSESNLSKPRMHSTSGIGKADWTVQKDVTPLVTCPADFTGSVNTQKESNPASVESYRELNRAKLDTVDNAKRVTKGDTLISAAGCYQQTKQNCVRQQVYSSTLQKDPFPRTSYSRYNCGDGLLNLLPIRNGNQIYSTERKSAKQSINGQLMLQNEHLELIEHASNGMKLPDADKLFNRNVSNCIHIPISSENRELNLFSAAPEALINSATVQLDCLESRDGLAAIDRKQHTLYAGKPVKFSEAAIARSAPNVQLNSFNNQSRRWTEYSCARGSSGDKSDDWKCNLTDAVYHELKPWLGSCTEQQKIIGLQSVKGGYSGLSSNTTNRLVEAQRYPHMHYSEWILRHGFPKELNETQLSRSIRAATGNNKSDHESQINNNNSDIHEDLNRGDHMAPLSPTSSKSKGRKLLSVLRTKIYRWPNRNSREKKTRQCQYGFQSNNEFNLSLREPLPLLRLEDLRSYTLTTSSATKLCDGKAKPEDETSDTFILSAASEFLHSTSDDVFAFKHRPRPGIATGRHKAITTKLTTASTVAGVMESNSSKQSEATVRSSPPADEQILMDQSEQGIEQEVVEMDTVMSTSSVDSNLTEPPASEADLDSQHTPPIIQPKTLPSIRVQKETKLGTRSTVRSRPFRRRRTPTKHTNVPKRQKQAKRLARVHIVKSNRKMRTKREKPPWNISTRNLATQFYAIRPIESLLWPGGRIPQTLETNEYHSQSETLSTREKRSSHQTRSESRKRHVIQTAKQQVNMGSSALCAVRHRATSRKAWWKLYRGLFKRRARQQRSPKLRKEFPIPLQHKKIQSNQFDFPGNNEILKNADGCKSGDLPSMATVSGEQRKRLHLHKTVGEGDRMLPPEVGQCSHQGDRLQRKAKFLNFRFARKRTSRAAKKSPITTRHLVGRPRLWTSVHRQPQSRSLLKKQTTSLTRKRRVRHRSASGVRYSRPGSGRKRVSTLNSAIKKARSHERLQNKLFPVFDTNRSSSINGSYLTVKKEERPERVDFFAYLAVIPSEIDEMVLPFRACNRLRMCLKSIDDLLAHLESEIAESNHKNIQSGTNNKLSYDIGDHKIVESPSSDITTTESTAETHQIKPRKKRTHLLDRIKRTFSKHKMISEPFEQFSDHSVKPGSPSEQLPGSLAVNNNSPAPSIRSATTAYSDTIRAPQLDPWRVQFWHEILRDCWDGRLTQLLREMERINDRRVFVIEQRTHSRIKLDETVIYSIRGLPCMELRIIAYNVTDLQQALVNLEMTLPRIYKQMVFSERFCGSASSGSARRFPTTNDFFFPSTEPASARQPSASTVCHIVPVIEEARKLRRSHRSIG